MRLSVLILLAAALVPRAAFAQGLEVFQGLDEATSRIARYDAKPFLDLMKANDGCFQDEVIIFRDLETGNEVWSLTREACSDIANIERRPAWSSNGQFISFIGNAAFLNYTNNRLWQRTWAGYNYVANADGSKKRKLWAKVDGKLRMFQDKFNNWDVKRPNVLYYPGAQGEGNILWRVKLGDRIDDATAEVIYRFPNAQLKTIQEISDENFMLVEESGDKPNCYVINLNKAPKDPHFCLTYPLQGMVHPGSFRFRRSERVITGGYERGRGGEGGITLAFDEKGLRPTTLKTHITAGVQMFHLWYGPPDDRVGYFGKYRDKMGLWLQMPGKTPVLMADVVDGHVSWCSHDPQWFFAAVGTGESPDRRYNRRLLAANADGKTVKILCTPFDRRRPGKPDYASIPRPNQSPDATKCWFHSSMLMPDNKYTGSYIAVFRKPYAPTALKAKHMAAGVVVDWTPHALSYEGKGYHVYRSDDRKTWTELTGATVDAPPFLDATAEAGKTYTYAVTAEEWSRLESDTTSPVVTVAPGRAGIAGKGVSNWDKTAPAAVADFHASRGADGLIALTWTPNTDKDLRYYNVYASSKGNPTVEQKRLLVSPTHEQNMYIDWSAPAGAKMSYAIVAVDRQGNVSEPRYAEIE